MNVGDWVVLSVILAIVFIGGTGFYSSIATEYNYETNITNFAVYNDTQNLQNTISSMRNQTDTGGFGVIGGFELLFKGGTETIKLVGNTITSIQKAFSFIGSSLGIDADLGSLVNYIILAVIILTILTAIWRFQLVG